MPHTLSKLFTDLIIGIVSLAMIAFTALKAKLHDPALANLGFSVAVIVSVLAGYHAFAYDLSLLLLPLGLLANHLYSAGWKIGLKPVGLIIPVIVLFFTPLQMFLLFHGEAYSLMALILLLWWWGFVREIETRTRALQTGPAALKPL